MCARLRILHDPKALPRRHENRSRARTVNCNVNAHLHDSIFKCRFCTHEWWDPDGIHAWSVWHTTGETCRVNVHTGEFDRFRWPVTTCLHSHSSADGRYLVCDACDNWYRGTATTVHFQDGQTGKTLKIIDNPAIDSYVGSSYHIDPHPRFCCGDRFVVFTATVRGRVDLAMVRTDDLVALI